MTDVAWTRATTIANTLEDRYGLENWAKRNVVLGIAARPDLYALAASCKPDDKAQLTSIVRDAEEAAKSRSGANLGTALHRITARIDTGEDLDVPAAWRPDVDAYLNTLADNSVKILPEYVERVVVASKPRIAGTFDRLISYEGTTYVADLKTGQGALEYQATQFAVQLAIYANADLVWKGSAEDADKNRDHHGRYLLPDPFCEHGKREAHQTYLPDMHEGPVCPGPGSDAYEAMPEVDKERAVIIHLPVETGTCSLHWVDIAAGVEGVKMALWVRDWRKRDLHYPLNPEPFGPSSPMAEVIPIGGATADDDW